VSDQRLTKTVMTTTDLREMAADCEKFNQTPPIQATEYERLYLRITRYAPRYMTEAAEEIERLSRPYHEREPPHCPTCSCSVSEATVPK
jgi:hypothetical protein